jgi:hypothetical protein
MKHVSSLMHRGPVAGFFLFLLWLAGPAARAQAPAWSQLGIALPGSGTAFSYVLAAAADAAGNVYVVGKFTGTVRFGATVLTSNASLGSYLTDAFVAKWNPATGAFAWALALGGTGNDEATAVALHNGAVYVGGTFGGPTATVGAFVLANNGTPGTSDVFVAKITDAGATAGVVWAQPAGGPGNDKLGGLAPAGSSVYFTGSFSGQSFAAGATTLTNAGAFANSTDVFVVKLADTGPAAGFVWAVGYGGTGYDEGRALAFGNGSLYVVGSYTTPTFLLGPTALPSAGAADVFVAKLLDASGTASVVWAQRAGGTGQDLGKGIALNGTSLYIVGTFGGVTATVGAFVLANAGGGNADGFVARLDDAGPTAGVVWAQPAGGGGDDDFNAVAVRGPHVYVAGSYGYPRATFGSTVLSNRGSGFFHDLFVAKLTDIGPGTAFAWVQSAGGTEGDGAMDLALVGNKVTVVGGAAEQAAFGSLAVPPLATPPSAGNVNTAAFVASLLDPVLATIAPAPGSLAFVLFPNPARTTASVQLPALPGVATATLALLDALGRQVRAQTAPTNARATLDLAGLAPGLYVLRVAAAGSTATQRLVVE